MRRRHNTDLSPPPHRYSRLLATTAEPQPPRPMGLLRVADAADRIIRWLGQATDWLSPRMLLETLQMLVPRYAFDQGSIVL